jgi:CHRD domain
MRFALSNIVVFSILGLTAGAGGVRVQHEEDSTNPTNIARKTTGGEEQARSSPLRDGGVVDAQLFYGKTKFTIQGTAGTGLLPGNEPAGTVVVPSTAIGGEIGAGVFYKTKNNTLTINVGWGPAVFGSGGSMTSTVILNHIHGPTASNNGNNFTEVAGVLFTLTPSSTAVTGGTYTEDIYLTDAQETDLLNGKFYINIHTTNNPGGEMRGFLIPVAY